MKRTIKDLSGLATIIALFMFASCEGPAGEDGNDSCKECHNQTNMSLKSTEYETSVHGMGTNVAYAGGRSACAMCHSHEGFVETQRTKRDTTATAILIPTRIDCATCHSGHVSFDTTDGTDYALRSKNAVNLMISSDASVVDFGGSSNLCLNCHQPRSGAPVADGNGDYKIANSRFGPHHGPQGTLVYGSGAYEGSGSVAYPAKGSSTHMSAGACVVCHMGESTADGGGHTFKPTVASCTKCHSNATNFDINGVQTEVHNLLNELANNLKAKGVLNSEGVLVLGTYPIALSGAYFNYISVEEDRSSGIHNPAYVKALLKNSIAATK